MAGTSRIASSPFRRWYQHKNFFMFLSTWIMLMSSCIPADASESNRPVQNFGKIPPGGAVKTQGPTWTGRQAAKALEVPKSTPTWTSPPAAAAVAAHVLPATTSTPELVSTPATAELAHAPAASPQQPVLRIAITESMPAPASADAALTLGIAFARVWRENEKVLKTLLSGAVAGIVSRTCTSPLEVVATLQMAGYGASAQSIPQQLTAMYRESGPRAFFRGNGANCLKVAPTRAIQFAVYERIKLLILKAQQERAGPGVEVQLSPYGRLCAGGIAGMIACSCVYPLEVVKTMLTVSAPGTYRGIGHAFAIAFKEGGLKGFYRGWLPTFCAMFPYVGVEFMIYETFKHWYAEGVRRGAERQGKDPLEVDTDLPVFVQLALGACAGAASQAAAHPLDVVRRRLQMQGKNGKPVEFANMLDCLWKLGRNEGVSALYRGLRPACAEKIPSTAITFFAYEVLKGWLGLKTV